MFAFATGMLIGSLIRPGITTAPSAEQRKKLNQEP